MLCFEKYRGIPSLYYNSALKAPKDLRLYPWVLCINGPNDFQLFSDVQLFPTESKTNGKPLAPWTVNITQASTMATSQWWTLQELMLPPLLEEIFIKVVIFRFSIALAIWASAG